MCNGINFNELVGKTLKSVENKDNEEIIFTTVNNEVYKLYHSQDCCESVTVEDVCGEVSDLIGSVIVTADEVINNQGETPAGMPDKDYEESFTWTFYKIGTAKGSVTIRWYGASNGCYAESVNFCKQDVQIA